MVIAIAEALMTTDRRGFLMTIGAAAAKVGLSPEAKPPQPATEPRRLDPFWGARDAEMIGWLGPRPGERVLDAGCGDGRHVGLLATAVAPEGSATALDIKPAALEKARARHDGAGYAAAIEYREGDVRKLDLPDGRFDLAWASHALHFQPDIVACVRELRRVVRPGGRVAVREDHFLSTLLPWDFGFGRPGLEHRLQLLLIDSFAADRNLPGAERPGVGWAQILRDAGLKDIVTKSFLFELSSPLTRDQGNYLVHLLKSKLGWGEKLDPEDRKALERLTDPDGPDYALNRHDLHIVDVSTVYVGIH